MVKIILETSVRRILKIRKKYRFKNKSQVKQIFDNMMYFLTSRFVVSSKMCIEKFTNRTSGN